MPTELPLSIFLSCGSPHTKSQEEFVATVEALLKSHGCVPQTVGRSSYSIRQPVQASRDLIGACHGAVIIAFERIRVLHGLERPDTDKQTELRNESYPTVWNQMEAAMAYAQKVPMLTFVQSGLKRQGMLSDRLEWMALETDLSTQFLQSDQFRQVFQEWLKLVKEGALRPRIPEIDPAELKLGALFSQLKTNQAWKLVTLVFGILATVATVAFKVGQEFPSLTQNTPQATTAGSTSAPPSRSKP